MLEFVCLPWSEVCSARVTSLLLLLLLSINHAYGEIPWSQSALPWLALGAVVSCSPTASVPAYVVSTVFPMCTARLGLSRCLGPGECLHSFIHCTQIVLHHNMVICRVMCGNTLTHPFKRLFTQAKISTNVNYHHHQLRVQELLPIPPTVIRPGLGT